MMKDGIGKLYLIELKFVIPNKDLDYLREMYPNLNIF